MARKDHMGTDHLRKGRLSIPHARYFITICTKERKSLLSSTAGFEAVRQALREVHSKGDISLYCATVMPDHIHLLLTLGDRLKLSQVVAKLKRQISKGQQAEKLWQTNFYDHRIRPDQELEPFANYIFLNPYRKNLIQCRQTWSGWILNKNYRPEFAAHLVDGRFPHEAWLASSVGCRDLIEEHSSGNEGFPIKS